MTTVAELLAWGRERLAGTPFEISGRESPLFLGDLLGKSEAHLLAHGEARVGAPEAARFRALIERRRGGEPAAYLLGRREFFGRSFVVDPRVLIPRPETEHLIETAIEISTRPHLRGRDLQILDIGSGSGCVAITLALELPSARVVATDLSAGALALTRLNARRLGAGNRVKPVGGDLGRPLRLEPFDLVVSNPPYIDPSEAQQLSPEILDHEPSLALFAPDRGDSILVRLVRELASLSCGVPALFEIGYGQSESLREAIRDTAFRLLEIRPDYSGIPRVAVLERR